MFFYVRARVRSLRKDHGQQPCNVAAIQSIIFRLTSTNNSQAIRFEIQHHGLVLPTCTYNIIIVHVNTMLRILLRACINCKTS